MPHSLLQVDAVPYLGSMIFNFKRMGLMYVIVKVDVPKHATVQAQHACTTCTPIDWSVCLS
jgi:hypothetical protein